jgi:acetyl esterase/lipase
VSVALASLAVLEAPTWPTLVLAIGATEWGHVLAALALAPVLPGWRRERAGRVGGMLGLGAALLSLSSLLRAALLARQLPARLTATFGDQPPRALPSATPRPTPFVGADVLRGVRSPRVRKSRHTYAARGSQSLELDLYQPLRAQGAAPGVLVVHGGSWHRGDNSQMPALNSYLAARGYVVAAINYRLAPEHRFPAARDDVLAAIDFLKARAADFGLDPQRLALIGRSAGGQLALLVAYTAGDPAIRGVISFYAPIDLVYGYYHPARKAVIDGVPLVESYLGGSPTTAPEVYAAASPTTFAASAPPTLLIHGGRDELVSPVQSERLAARLQASGRPHFYLCLPWATHGCDVNFSGPSGQVSTYAVERFLAGVVGG